MNETTSFGYEQENGNIIYTISKELTLDEIEIYLTERVIPCKLNVTMNVKSESITDYFSEKKFEQDKSIWRILYMLDGSTICKRYGSTGRFIYNIN